jgi:hypothetical protein
MTTSPDAELLARYAVPEHLELGPSESLRERGTGVRSHLADGRGVAWLVPDALVGRAAIDAELATQRVPGKVAKRARSTDPAVVWPRWTQCEVTAKLLGLPVLSWLEWPGLIVPGEFARQVRFEQVRLDDVLVCCGLRKGARPHDQ